MSSERLSTYILLSILSSFGFTIVIGITSLIFKLLIPSAPLTISPINATEIFPVEGIVLVIVLIFLDIKYSLLNDYGKEEEIDNSTFVKAVYLIFSSMLYNIHFVLPFPLNYLSFIGLVIVFNILTGMIASFVALFFPTFSLRFRQT